MKSEHLLVENNGMSAQKNDGESDGLSESSPRGGTASQEIECMKNLLMADWKDLWGMPMTADELLIIGNKAFETLFQQPPVGPMPEYLIPHLSVYGCVAEYEEKLEELDRWKALGLGRWLKDRIGKNWCVAGKVYQLQGEKQESVASEKFWFRLIEDRTEGVKPGANES